MAIMNLLFSIYIEAFNIIQEMLVKHTLLFIHEVAPNNGFDKWKTHTCSSVWYESKCTSE